MDSFGSLATVSVISLLGAISPGPDFFIVVKNSLSYSRKIGFFTSFGICSSLLMHLFYSLMGIGILISQNPFFYHFLKFIGAGYLFYIGSKSIILCFKKKSHSSLNYVHMGNSISRFTAFKQGFLTNLLNPKCAIFFVSLFSQFITKETPLFLKMGYFCINWSISLIWFLFLSFIITGNVIISRINGWRAYLDVTMGCILILISLKLIIT